jgi:hypothetical protein
VETAVLVPIEDWRRLQRAARPGLKELLLCTDPIMEDVGVERGDLRRRDLVEFE